MDEQDDRAAPRRTGRLRQLVVAGVAVVVLALGGLVGANVLRNDPGGPPAPSALQAPGVSVPPADPQAVQTRVGPDTPYLAVPPGTNPPEWLPTAAPVAAADPRPVDGPLGPGTGACADGQDPALRALVEEALRRPRGPGDPGLPAGRAGRRPGRARRAADGDLSPAWTDPGAARRRADRAPTASGGTVVVESRPDLAEDPAPFADRLDTTVAYLAPRL